MKKMSITYLLISNWMGGWVHSKRSGGRHNAIQLLRNWLNQFSAKLWVLRYGRYIDEFGVRLIWWF
jgi:hypothetical protein